MTGHVYKQNKRCEVRSAEERVIMRDGDASSSSVASESDRASDKANSSGRRRLSHALDTFLSSLRFQAVVVALVLCDCVVVVVALLVDLRIFELDDGDFVRSLGAALSVAHVALLGAFVVEMTLKLLVWGPRRMARARMELFDCAVVVVALGLALAFGGRRASTDGFGLLVLLRLWRLSRILAGLVSSVRADAERRLTKERRARRALEREVVKLREYCGQQEMELQMYRVMLQQHDIPQPTVLRLPAAPRRLNVIAEVNEQSRADADDPPPDYCQSMAVSPVAAAASADSPVAV